MQNAQRRRAVGIVRVSQVAGRSGDSFVSPVEQRRSIETQCAREGADLVAVFEELDVSGGAPLRKRPGMRQAIELVETGQADLILAAYFDRLIRSLAVQQEILERVERAGGRVAAVDCGEIRSDTAARWLSSTMMGMVAEYYRRITGEKIGEARANAILRGVPTFPGQIPGYRRAKHAPFEVDEQVAPIMAEAFRRRGNGASLADIRSFLAEHGIRYSYVGVRKMFKSRVFLGELRCGKVVNLTAHPPIIERAVWQRAQRVEHTRGRKAKGGPRLMARLGILRCGRCDAAMTASLTPGGKYEIYRCGMMGACPGVSISGPILDGVVGDYVRGLLTDRHGEAVPDERVTEAAAEYERRVQVLDEAVEEFEGITSARVKGKLLELQHAVEEAAEVLGRLKAAAGVAERFDPNAPHAWDEQATLDEKRALIRATLQRVTVHPAPDRRGARAGAAGALERLTFEPLVE